ncbi:MAG: tail fiber protein [Verrucomicrobiales bacterium]
MKRNRSFVQAALCATLLLLPVTLPVLAQNAKPPTQLTYQGFLTDANGVPFGNTAPVNKTVIFRIYDGLTGGVIKWSSQQVVTVDKGYFSVLLGQGSGVGAEPFSANLTGVFSGSTASDRYLELSVDGSTIAPRLRFLPAPYAMLSKSATELVDPITGAASIAISGGNVSASGSLSSTSITGGAINSTGNIGATGNVSTKGSVYSSGALAASGEVDTHSQGAYIEWNKECCGGMSYILNQKGGGTGGMVFGEVSTANVITERMRIDGSGNVGIGTKTPTAKLEVSGAAKATSFEGYGTIPIGGIIMWSGSTVPAGWALCNGGTSNGKQTPDLRDKFIVGSGSSYATGNTGGSSTVALSAGHLPTFSIDYKDIYYSEGGGTITVPNNRGSGDTDSDNKGYEMSRTATRNGTATAFSILPPYYALAFIMRVQ